MAGRTRRRGRTRAGPRMLGHRRKCHGVRGSMTARSKLRHCRTKEERRRGCIMIILSSLSIWARPGPVESFLVAKVSIRIGEHRRCRPGGIDRVRELKAGFEPCLGQPLAWARRYPQLSRVRRGPRTAAGYRIARCNAKGEKLVTAWNYISRQLENTIVHKSLQWVP